MMYNIVLYWRFKTVQDRSKWNYKECRIKSFEKGSSSDSNIEDTITSSGKELKGASDCQTKILKLPWKEDAFVVLEITAPVMVIGMLMFRETCLKKLRWDEMKKFLKKPHGENGFAHWKTQIWPSLDVLAGATLKEIWLHSLSDVCKSGVCAAIYVNIQF